MGSGNVSHCGTPSFNDHLDLCIVVFKHIHTNFLTRRCTFEEIKSTLSRSKIFPWIFFRDGSSCGLTRTKFVYGSHRSWLLWYVLPWRTATIRSLKASAGVPNILNPASKEMISDSVELWETDVCFLHIQLIGTNVWLPKMHSVPPDIDFESSRSPAKSESWNSLSLHCFAVFPTWQYCNHTCDVTEYYLRAPRQLLLGFEAQPRGDHLLTRVRY